LLQKNLPFHVLLEKEVQETPFGQLTFNMELKDGLVNLRSVNCVKNKRVRYKLDKDLT
jgi:hypothetical protein